MIFIFSFRVSIWLSLRSFVSLMYMDSGDSVVDSKGKGKKMEKKERRMSAGECLSVSFIIDSLIYRSNYTLLIVL